MSLLDRLVRRRARLEHEAEVLDAINGLRATLAAQQLGLRALAIRVRAIDKKLDVLLSTTTYPRLPTPKELAHDPDRAPPPHPLDAGGYGPPGGPGPSVNPLELRMAVDPG